MATVSSQPNGITSSGSTAPSQSQSQPTQSSSTTVTGPSQATATPANTAAAPTTNGAPTSPTPANPGGGGNSNATTHAPKPRDARTIELLLMSQGVTSYDPRVPQLLMDFGYRHTSSVLSDALHLAADPYTTQAGSRPSGASGVTPSAPAAGDAAVSVGAVGIAIASRQAYQFRGGSGAGGGGGGGASGGGSVGAAGSGTAGGPGGGGASKDWLLELAKERNRIALPRVLQHEWGVRLPNERFVLSGMGWDLRDTWAEGSDDDDDDDDEEDDEDADADAMEGVETGAKKDGGNKDDAGGLDELLGDDMADVDADEDMEGME